MTFTSLVFLVFFACFLCLYWQLKGRQRLWLCLTGSYLFYGWWNWYLLSLILFSTTVDFVIAKRLDRTDAPLQRRSLLAISVVTNLGLLGFFKYFNFFADSLQAAVGQFGWQLDWATINIILPVGISFYTFQSLSYSIDVFRRKLSYEPDFIRFATFVAFFPQLVAGPIVRASDFLPQLKSDRQYKWEDTVEGFGQILLGFFKKLVVADTLAVVVDKMFEAPEGYGSLNMILIAILFPFQVYGDFSGYSDIAIGSARMLGFRLPRNFHFPFFATSIADFWQRWHISLSTWLRDYLYIPLGGNRHGTWMTYRNLIITMTLGGLWHGARWTFVVWGLAYGILLAVEKAFAGQFYVPLSNLRIVAAFQRTAMRCVAPVLVTGILVVSLVIFRSSSLSEAMMIYGRILSLEDFSPNALHNRIPLLKSIGAIGMLLAGEFACQFVSLSRIFTLLPPLRIVAYAGLIWCIALLGAFSGNSFVYFQF